MSHGKSDEKWYYITANDKSCQGYMPGGNIEEACNTFGMKPKDCKVVEVVKTVNGFVLKDNIEQLKLL